MEEKIKKRGRPPKNIPLIENNSTSSSKQFTRTFIEDNITEIWTYDLDKFNKGPISVEIKYKAGTDKGWNKIQKIAKEERKIARRDKKIKNKKNSKK